MLLTRDFLHRQGAQGSYDEASNAALENEFGTHNEDEVIKKILEKGVLHQSQVGFSTPMTGRPPQRNCVR